MTDHTPEQRSCIRRSPQSDRLLAEAVRRLHETGPRLVVELEQEIERLQRQLERLQKTTTHARSEELVGLLKG
jgi:hypothetical protein